VPDTDVAVVGDLLDGCGEERPRSEAAETTATAATIEGSPMRNDHPVSSPDCVPLQDPAGMPQMLSAHVTTRGTTTGRFPVVALPPSGLRPTCQGMPQPDDP